MAFFDEYKKSFLIRKIEEFFLEMFKLGKISGTVHTCVGQEFTGVFAAKYSIKGDYVVSNHRGHGHYISFTNDYLGLIGELLGSPLGCSKGVGGSQHLYNQYFLSNGIQGGMLPISAGLALSNKIAKSNNISISFLGDGTLGEGILYETLNLSALWSIPMVYILEKNYMSQSTSFDQNFHGSIKGRILGFGIKYYNTSIYDMQDLDKSFQDAFRHCRNNSEPVFIEVEVGRLNSHSKGDDNRDPVLIDSLREKDPLNIFIRENKELINNWEDEFDECIQSVLGELNSNVALSEDVISSISNPDKTLSQVNVDPLSNKRFNELIYDELDKILSLFEDSIIIGEDIENNNIYNPNEYGGAFKVTRDLSNKFPDRVRNTPISEQAITGVAIGAALKGNISIVEIMFGDFTTLVLDQLLQHVSKFTLMYGTELKIPFILRTPMGGFRGYGPTHSQSLEKHFLGIPGLKVIALNQLVAPSEIFGQIVKLKQPILLIENKVLYTKKLYENFPSAYSLLSIDNESGFPVRILRPIDGKSEITLVCYGGIVDEVLKAVNSLFIEEEILVDIFIVSEISDVDLPTINHSVIETKKLCFVEEGSSFASFSSEVIARLVENGCADFSLLRISNNTIIPSNRESEQKVLPNSSKIKSELIKFTK